MAMQHISRVHSHCSGFSITCGINGCLRTYTNYTSWSRHVRQVHKIHAQQETVSTTTTDPDTDTMDTSDTTDMDMMYTETMECDDAPPSRSRQLDETEKKKERACWILKLRDGNKLTQSCTEKILGNVSELCMQIISDIKEAVAQELRDNNISNMCTRKILTILDNPQYSEPFKGLETKHLQMAVFRQHLGYVVSLNLPTQIV